MFKLSLWRLCIAVLPALISCGTLDAQSRPGYIITNDNDTVFGNIEFEGSIANSYQCRFFASTGESGHLYSPGDIKGFRFIDGKYFTTEEIDINGQTRKVFLEWLIRGKASLLTYSPRDTDVRYFLLGVDGKTQELINTKHLVEKTGDTYEFQRNTYEHQKKEYVGVLLYEFQNAPSLANEIRNVPLSTKPLIKITRKYHELTCPGEDCLIFEDKTRKMKLALVVTAGFQRSLVKFNYPEVEEKAYPSYSIGPGILLELSNLPLISPKFSFSAGASFYKFLYKYDIEGMPYYYTDERVCEFKIVKIPLQFNYEFLAGRISPFISAGLMLNLRTGYREFDNYLVSYVTAHPTGYLLGMRIFQLGVSPGLGLRYSFSGRSALKVKLDYEHGFRFYGKSISDDTYNNNYILQVSYMYSF